MTLRRLGKRVTDPARVLLFHEDFPTPESLRLRTELVKEGFEVSCVYTFVEMAYFVGAGRTDIFLIYLPESEWVRNAMLNEVRRAKPMLPIVAMASIVSQDLLQLLARFRVTSVLATRGDCRGVANALHDALDSCPQATERQA